MEHMQIFDMATPKGRAEIERYEAERAEKVTTGQQLYAKIKRSSKYYGQTGKCALFPVYVIHGGAGGYVIQGGPGGQYRLEDVNLFVVDDGREMRIA